MAAPAALPTLATLHAELVALLSDGARLVIRLPPPWAALLVLVGIVFLLHGARQRHVLAVPGGAVLGVVAAWLAAHLARGSAAAAPPELYWVSAGVCALACAAWPPLFPALAVALPGFALGWTLPVGGHAWLGGALGAAGGAVLGGLTREWVASLAAGGLGAAATVAGLLALLSHGPVGRALGAHPMALVAIWAVLAVAGAAFHAGRAWPEERRAESGTFLGDRPLHGEAPEHDGWRG